MLCYIILQCIDTDGSYQCICYDGYRYTLNNSSPVCENINECLEQSEPCSLYADCVDLIGSAKYECTCKDGYEGDGQTCNSKCVILIYE